MENSSFTITRDNDNLVFKTSSFSTIQQSVLHSGAFNREMASSIAAGVVMMILLFIFRSHLVFSVFALILGVLFFGLLFLLFRRFVFKEPLLEALFDKSGGILLVKKSGEMFPVRRRFRLADVVSVFVKDMTHKYSNPDGIEMVEKIALHHHTALPGFGRTVRLHAAAIRFRDERELILFSSEDKNDTDRVIEEINQFLEVRNAETDRH